jgi:hypothetical protein
MAPRSRRRFVPSTAPEQLEQGQRWIPKVGWRVDDEVWLLPHVVQDAVKRHLGPEWRWGAREFRRSSLDTCRDRRPQPRREEVHVDRAVPGVGPQCKGRPRDVPTVEAPSMADEEI